MTEPAWLLYSVACNHLAKVSAIIDSLVQMKAHDELKRLASRLERLSFKATPNEEALKPGRKLLRWRIEPVFTPKETRLDFIRAPIASELKRREADYLGG